MTIPALAINKTQKIEIHCVEKIKEIHPEEWNIPGIPEELFHSLEFLEVLEKAKVEDSRMFYLIARKDGKVVATTVLSIFKISLDLFIGDQSWVRWINRNFPNFFKVKILFCGTPVSIGHKNLSLAEGVEAAEILGLFEEKMKEIAVQHKVKHLITKELDSERRVTWGKDFLNLNWFEGYSIPDVKMNMRWDSYKAYLKTMRYPFRRQIMGSLKKLNNGKAIENYAQFISDKIKILRADEVDVKEFYEKYLEVMKRATVKLETLNLPFFEQLFETCKKEIRIFSYINEVSDQSYFFTIHKGSTLYFLWTARNESKDSRDVYFNLYQAMICYAIKHKVQLFHLGQTAYYAKMRIGGIPQPRFIYYKCLNRFQHLILNSMRLLIFPELKLKPLNVFQSAHHDQKQQSQPNDTQARGERLPVT